MRRNRSGCSGYFRVAPLILSHRFSSLFIHLKHNQIDKHQWDQALLNCYNSRIYACSWYLDVVCPNWEALATDKYKLLFPLSSKRKFSFAYLHTPPFVQQLGLFYQEPSSNNRIDECLQSIPPSFRFIELNLNEENQVTAENFNQVQNQNFILSLQDSYEQIAKGFSSNHKRNLKKAEAADMQLVSDADVEAIIELFKNDRGKKIKSFSTREYHMLHSLCDAVKSHAELLTLGVHNSNSKLICGALIFKFGNRLTFIFSGNSEEGKTKAAMFFLIHELIKMFSSSHFILDFEGSNDLGLAQFYRGFGAEKKTYPHIKKNNLPALVKLIKK